MLQYQGLYYDKWNSIDNLHIIQLTPLLTNWPLKLANKPTECIPETTFKGIVSWDRGGLLMVLLDRCEVRIQSPNIYITFLCRLHIKYKIYMYCRLLIWKCTPQLRRACWGAKCSQRYPNVYWSSHRQDLAGELSNSGVVENAHAMSKGRRACSVKNRGNWYNLISLQCSSEHPFN
jgi:hypothetical protein